MADPAEPTPETLLAFWFAGSESDPVRARERTAQWFGEDADLDAECTRRFGPWLDAALGEGPGPSSPDPDCDFATWEGSARGSLARILLLDQLPRNVFRGSARAFAGDARALAVAKRALSRAFDHPLSVVERLFLYLPFEHAESLPEQERSLELFDALVAEAGPEWRELAAGYRAYAREHRDTIARFGRFPSRNAALGRTSTPDEAHYLARPAGGEPAP